MISLNVKMDMMLYQKAYNMRFSSTMDMDIGLKISGDERWENRCYEYIYNRWTASRS